MKNKRALFVVPYVGWMALFVVAPIIMVVIYAFSSAEGGFTLENFASMGTYASVFTRSFWLALLATAICLLIGYPAAYFISREGPRFQRVAMMLIMLPMWMNFLLRTYSWMSVLENNGLLNQLFRNIGLIGLYNRIAGSFGGTPIDHFQMIGTSGAVVLGMVYNYLPFMILPIYSVIEKMDGSLVEAARDLGATPWQAFRTVSLKLTLPGLLSGVVLTFVPSMGLFFIADILGGNKVVLVGNLIQEQLMKAHNWPFAAALSMALLGLTTLLLFLYRKVSGVKELEGLV